MFSFDVQSPALYVPYIDNVVNLCGFGFIEAMLEPHARKNAGLSPINIRNIFFTNGSAYFVGTLIAGYVSRHMSDYEA